MKERLIGLAIGVGACAALAIAYGFQQEAPTTSASVQETTYCYQLYDRVDRYYDGAPSSADLYMLDSCTGDAWRLNNGKFEPVPR